MKITGLSTLQAVSRTQNTQESTRKNNVPLAASGDRLEFTDNMVSFQAAREALNNTAEPKQARFDRISNIQARIQAGTYSIDAYEVASKIVDARI